MVSPVRLRLFSLGSSLLLLVSIQSSFSQTLSNGDTLSVTANGPTAASLVADNSSWVVEDYKTGMIGSTGGAFGYPAGETGGAYGVVNLMTSGYNAFVFNGDTTAFSPQYFSAVYPLSPAQRASATPLFTQTYTIPQGVTEYAKTINRYGVASGIIYEPNGFTPKKGFDYSFVKYTAIPSSPIGVYTLTSNQPEGVNSWFHTGQSSSTPAPPFTVIGYNSAVVAYDGSQLHFINLGNNVDTVIPVPTDWAGDVAIAAMSEQGANTSDGYRASYYYAKATVTPKETAPTGTLSVNKNMVGQNGQVAFTWSVTPTTP